jgi:hypothetical protein
MSDTNTGGPAFPLPSHTRKWDDAKKEYQQDEGMTLRDYFAAKAMQGLINEQSLKSYEAVAVEAYKQADAMLKARDAK